MVQAAAKLSSAVAPRFRGKEALRALDDTTLVRAHLASEPLAFDVLVERYQVRLQNFVYRIVGDRDRAEDLVQEAFVRVHRHMARFDRTKKFSTWIYTITSNLGKNELRNRGRSPLVLFSALAPAHDEVERPVDFEDPAAPPDEVFRRRHLNEAIMNSVAKLPAHHRDVFVLREIEGRSYEEIAELTRCNLGTVKSRLNRARNAFAEIIEPALR
ncbi:MAG: sigma-70 family RNA polymerase sigma factor [Gemmatimonadetes bacterium]|nr:sigma-70 family RNA polymerase sigma factor [Gemmatimonadota bacterium]